MVSMADPAALSALHLYSPLWDSLMLVTVRVLLVSSNPVMPPVTCPLLDTMLNEDEFTSSCLSFLHNIVGLGTPLAVQFIATLPPTSVIAISTPA